MKLALGGRKETLNEMVVHPVSRMEFMEYGKILSKIQFISMICIVHIGARLPYH